MPENQQIRYVRAAEGEVSAAQFESVRVPMPVPADGQVLVENLYLSLDPYQRRQMMPGVQYAQPLQLGGVMTGRAIGRVLVSRSPRSKAGDWVRGSFGWQTHAVVDAQDAEAVDLDGFAPSAYLGVLGSPGVTAWVGLHEVARIQPGETVMISAVTGAVGSVAAALAKAHGCRVIGIAGGPEKCGFALRELQCDACIDHRGNAFMDALQEATPGGVDVDFENVGGFVFDQVLTRLNDFARVALCGLVSQYNLVEPYGMRNTAALLNKNVMLQGFRVTHYARHREQAFAAIKTLLRDGRLTPRETVAAGLENAPAAFIAMLQGGNLGKQLVQLAKA